LAFLAWGCAERHGQDGAEPQATAAIPAAGSGNPRITSAARGGAAGRPAASTTPAKAGARASVTLDGLDPEGPNGEQSLHGEASFRVSDAGVDLTMSVLGCTTGRKYEVYILAGGDCSSQTLEGERWDSPRGEGIADLDCGTTRYARGLHMRSSKDAKPWTVEGPAASNLIGHAMVVYDGDHPSACGVIMLDAAAPSPDTGDQLDAVPLELRAQIAGLCLARSIVRDNAQECPNAKELEACSRAHCDLDPCVQVCSGSGYIACLQREPDGCAAEPICEIDAKCAECQSMVSSCTFNFCANQIACAAPVTPGGPCSQLQACCAMQGDMAPMCLELVQTIAKFSGDPSCYGIQHDWDFFSHLPVPCKFE
jgi:hypothetical protein